MLPQWRVLPEWAGTPTEVCCGDDAANRKNREGRVELPRHGEL